MVCKRCLCVGGMGREIGSDPFCHSSSPAADFTVPVVITHRMGARHHHDSAWSGRDLAAGDAIGSRFRAPKFLGQLHDSPVTDLLTEIAHAAAFVVHRIS